jgi:beta-N-acetylhexosaminidase
MKWKSPIKTSELLMLRLPAPRWSSSLERRLRALEPGGILLAGPLPGSPETLSELLGNISRCLPVPPILALESEGGGKDPLNALLPPLSPPRALAHKGAQFVRLAGELVGEALKLLGFDTHFALTLDLTSEDTLEELGGRIYIEDPQIVAEAGAAYVEGLTWHKILACAKHFPGLGGVLPVPTPSGELPVSGRSMADLWCRDLVPYRRLLEHLSFVLMSAASYKAYDFDYPRSAVLSTRVVEGLLRGRNLKYRGVVVAPQLESSVVRGALDEGQAAVQALIASCDMLLVEKDASWQAMCRGIEAGLASGMLPRERLEDSVWRIRTARLISAPKKNPFSKTAWERLVRRYEAFNPRYREAKRA